MTGIAEVENAMVARLQAASDADVLGYRYRTLGSYREDFDAYLKEEIKGDRAFPAAWVVFGGWRPPIDEGATLQAPALFILVVAAQNLRNEKSQRQGATAAEVGSYQLMIDAAALLHGQRLGLDIQALKLGASRSIRLSQTITERQLSVFALEFTTLLPIDVARFPVREIGDFSTFHADWDVQPFGQAALDPTDATDHLELPQ